MANYTLFISVTDVKQTGYIDENVDDTLIRNVIYNAQQFNILPLLGTALYDEIEDAIINDNPTPDETTLLTKIRPALLWWTHYEGVIPFSIRIRNKGVTKSNSDNSQPVGDGELKTLMDWFKDRAEEYSERCKNYLTENAATKFPSYLNPGTSVDTVHPEKTQYTLGWVLGKSKSGCDDIDRYENPGTCCD